LLRANFVSDFLSCFDTFDTTEHASAGRGGVSLTLTPTVSLAIIPQFMEYGPSIQSLSTLASRRVRNLVPACLSSETRLKEQQPDHVKRPFHPYMIPSEMMVYDGVYSLVMFSCY
jgi:hypothetical protein